MQETQETQVGSPGQENLLEKEMATHSSILAWEIPWTEEPCGLQSVGSQRVRHDCAYTHTARCMFNFIRNCQTFVKWLYHFSFPQPFDIVSLLNFSHPTGHVVVFHCGFNLQFLMNIFSCAYFPSLSLFWCTVCSNCLLLGILFLLNCESSLHIL